MGSNEPAVDEEANSHQDQEEDNTESHSANHRQVAGSLRGCRGRPSDDKAAPSPHPTSWPHPNLYPKPTFGPRDSCRALVLVMVHEDLYSHLIDGQ